MKHKPIRRFLVAGLLIWLPVVATFLVIRFLVEVLDKSLALIPQAYQPANLLGFNVPGLGVILSLVVVLATGVIATNVLGRHLVRLWEALVTRIPLVRTIYKAVKQVSETIFSSSSQAFRKVLLVEYPRRGLWSVAFKTGEAATEIDAHTGEKMITIFLPTTPNPTSGFLMMVPKNDVVELKMSIDEAMKLIISLGVVQPGMEVHPEPIKVQKRSKKAVDHSSSSTA